MTSERRAEPAQIDRFRFLKVIDKGNAMNSHVSSKTIRRLQAAEGYLELNMSKNAWDELELIEDPGPLEAVVEFLKGGALKGQERYEEAVVPLKRAAELVPAPHNPQAWLSLSECFRQEAKRNSPKWRKSWLVPKPLRLYKSLSIWNFQSPSIDIPDRMSRMT
jgi:hypothetical protein